VNISGYLRAFGKTLPHKSGRTEQNGSIDKMEIGMAVPLGAAEGAGHTPEQLRWLDLRMKRGGSPPPGPIPKRGSDGPVRLSYAQADLWYSCRREPRNSAYLVPRVFEIDGLLDVARLGSALSRVVERHEAMRTVFIERDGEPVQIIQPAVPVPLSVVDLSDGEVWAWLREVTARPMDLAAGPLLEALLARTGTRKHVLLLRWHHIVSDQPSGRILDDEIGRIYGGQEPEEPAVQYGDYAAWEPERLQSRDPEKARSFWRSYLDGAPPLLDLSYGRVRPVEPGYRGHEQVFELDPALAAQIRAFGVARRVTLFPIFLAAWGLLLNRYSQRNDLVVGVPVSGRDVPELERAIGYFVNILPLRLEVRPGATFEDLARDCWKRFLQCSASALPLGAIVDAVRPERSRSYSPLFQFVLNYLREGAQGLQLEGSTTRKISFHNGGSPFDLTITAVDRAPDIRIKIEYNSALFDSRTIHRMAGHFLAILREAAIPESVNLETIGTLSPEERHAALFGRNATEEPLSREETVLTCFHRRANEAPGRLILRSDKISWSRGELNAFAGRVAAALEREGVGPGDIVAVNAERKPEIVGIMLGIWKRGAVWLPIDPRWPPARAQFVIEDSGAKIAIDSGWLGDRLPACASESEIRVSPDSIAYVVYTSGSAGRPKGVAIRHGSLLNCLLSMQRSPGFSAEDTLFSVTPLNFDISLCEILLPLVSGATLVFPDLETATNPRAVKRLLEALDGITVMQATPVMWRSVIEEGWKGSPRMRVWFGGETLLPQLAESLMDRASEVWNLYGPTETTMCSTVHRVARGESPVPIGRPLANTQCYVLDGNLQPVPDGVPGELYIGGAGVSPGYRGHAKEQADKFPLNPFIPGERMYRTGDIVLWSSAADLVFLHRGDMQVKLRGHRIELGEVEAVLAMLPAVRQAVAGVHDEALVAWVVPSDPGRWDARQLRTELRTRLPEYMVPGIFVPVDCFPLNSSGKVDRNKLPLPEKRTNHAEENAAAPETGLIEQSLRDLWEELLDVRPIGLDDDFFQLGGHSLLAAKLFGRIEKVFGKRLPDSVLLQAPTIAGLVSILRAESGCGFQSLVPMQPLGDRPPFFLVHGFEGSVLSLRELARSLGPGQPVYGFEAIGRDGNQPPHFRIEDMADHYIREMRIRQPRGPYYIGGYCLGGLVAFEIARQLNAGGEQVAFLAILEASSGLKGSLVRRRYVPRLLNRARRHFRAWRPLPAKEKLSYVLSRLSRRRPGSLLFEALCKSRPAAVMSLLSGFDPVIVTLTVAARRYKPLSCSSVVTLFKAASPRAFTGDPSFGWAAVAQKGVEVEDIPGDHSTMLDQPNLQVLAARLDHRLRLAQAAAAETTAGREAQP
jgi:amino acid adenylation domain-containing protein